MDRAIAALAIVALAGCERVLRLDDIHPAMDALPFEDCPATYIAIDGTPAANRYRFVADASHVWQEAETLCEFDTDHSTHLAVFEGTVDEAAIIDYLTAMSSYRCYTGYAHDTGADPKVFFAVTGEEVDAGDPLWSTGEPNGSTGSDEETVTWTGIGHTGIVDSPWNMPESYICACDHRPVTRTFVLHP